MIRSTGKIRGFWIDDPTSEKVDLLASTAGISRSQVIQQLIKAAQSIEVSNINIATVINNKEEEGKKHE